MADVQDRLAVALADRYRILRELGRGGMAVVFLAEDLKHHRKVALKVLKPELAQSLFAERFLREIETVAGLTHPHILPLHDSGEAGGFLYYVMPYVEGESLRERLNRERQLPLDDALEITREVADALSYAHSLGIIHRDIKPENILFEAGHAVVSDFGIARAIDRAATEHLTETGLAVGTPAYMAPEQAGGGPVDGRADVYALGCVLYEMLAGEPPFTGATPQAMLARKSVEQVPSLRVVRESVPQAVEQAITRALARAPADRFRTPNELTAALDSFEAAGDSAAPASRRPRHWVPLAVTGAALVVVGGSWQLWRVVGAATPEPATVAVTTFANLSADPQDAYLSDGLTDAIITRLGRLGRVAVKSRNAVEHYSERMGSDPETLGEALGATHLVLGRLNRSGNELRIAVELVRSDGGIHVWGDQYVAGTSEFLSVEQRIAEAIAGAVAGRLLPAERASLQAQPTVHVEAYDHVLRGNYQLAQRTSVSVARAVREYESAFRLDPQFAAALARTAYAYALFVDWGWEYPGHSVQSLLTRGFDLVDRALRADSNLADAWMARGYLLSHLHPETLEGVQQAFARAIALDRGNAEAHHRYAFTWQLLGSDSAAVAWAESTLALEPERPITVTDLADLFFGRRRYADALAWSDSAIALSPTFAYAYVQRCVFRLYAGDIRGAQADLEMMRRLMGPGDVTARGVGALVHARLGERRAADSLAGAALGTLGSGTLGREARHVAAALAVLGEADRSLDVLVRIEPRGAHLRYWLRWPTFDSLRRHPRFQRLVASLEADTDGG